MLSESNQKAFDEAVKSLQRYLVAMQEKKEHGEVKLLLNMVSGGVAGCTCTQSSTNKIK